VCVQRGALVRQSCQAEQSQRRRPTRCCSRAKQRSLGRVGRPSCSDIFRRVTAGRWLQLAGVIKLSEPQGRVGCCRNHWTSEFVSCDVFFGVCVQGGALVRQGCQVGQSQRRRPSRCCGEADWFSIRSAGRSSCGGIFRRVTVGRWLQLAGVVKLLEDNGGSDHVVAVSPNSVPSGVLGGRVAVTSSGV